MASLLSLIEQANSLHVGITEDYKQRIQVTKSFFQATPTPSIRKMEGDNASEIELKRQRNIAESYRVSGLSGPMYF